MTAKRIVQAVSSMFKGMWIRHQLTLGLLVAATFSSRRLTVTTLGRFLATRTAPKHAIKRVDRFLSSRFFDDRAARESYLRTVIGPRTRIVVAVDWTKIRQWPVLCAGLCCRGRCVPLLWAVCDPQKLHKSQNAFEHGFLSWLAASLPPGVEATVLLDRGFNRVELLGQLKKLGLHVVLRTGGTVHIHSEPYSGPLQGLIEHVGASCDLREVSLRPRRPVTSRLVGIWAPGCKEPWLLLTDLELPPARIIALYQRRFAIEETFRDQKNGRLGLCLGETLCKRAQRMERLLLVAALAHLLAMLVGLRARQQGLDRLYRANTVKRVATHSDFVLGLYFIFRLGIPPRATLRSFYETEVDTWRG